MACSSSSILLLQVSGGGGREREILDTRAQQAVVVFAFCFCAITRSNVVPHREYYYKMKGGLIVCWDASRCRPVSTLSGHRYVHM